MQRHSLRVSLRLSAAASVMALASAAHADIGTDIGESDLQTIERIEVTTSVLGVLREESVSSVDVLDRAELQRDLGYSIADTLERLPGVSTTFFGPAAGRPVVRGLSNDRVRVLINGLDGLDASNSSPDHAIASDVLGATAVEVLRGPAAIGYGGGAIGGVVNILDGRIPEQMPDRPVSGEAYAGMSSVDDGSQFFGRVTGVVADGLVLQGEYQRRVASDYSIPGFAESRRAREGHGQVVGIVGEPGLGKSRLVHEFISGPDVEGFPILESGALELDASAGLLVIKKLVQAACGLDDAAGAAAADRLERVCGERRLATLGESGQDGREVGSPEEKRVGSRKRDAVHTSGGQGARRDDLEVGPCDPFAGHSFHPISQGEDGDECRDADDDAQRRKHRAKGVRPESVEANSSPVKVRHGFR
jgi:hypothetical protein